MHKFQIEHLSKTYSARHGSVIALEDITLSIRPNEFVTLVGPSGCGKSTLLKLIGALIKPSRGVLLHDGTQLSGPTRDVGIVFQEAVLLQWRTVSTTFSCRLRFSVSTSASRERAPWS